MTTDTTAAPVGIAATRDPNPPDRSEIDRPRAGNSADPTAIVPKGDRRSASPETERLYAADWRAFEDWCHLRSLVTLPADAATVASFLTDGATALSAGALSRRAAAIAAKHRRSGLASPSSDPEVTAILNAARRAATPRRSAPEPAATLVRMAVRCPRDLAGVRDRALLLLAASGLGRVALVGLDVEHICFTSTGVELSSGAVGIRAGQRATGQGRGDSVVVHRSADRATCPVQALGDWLATSDTKFGPVFRKIDRWGTLEHHRLGTDAIRRILARRALRRIARPHRAPGRTRKGRAA